jgi:predicted nucleic acid-binding protein
LPDDRFSGAHFAPAQPNYWLRAFGISLFFCRDLPVAPEFALDPKDRYLLALAEASQSDFLVTGDKDLLSLKHHKSTRIVTPAAMIEILKTPDNK